MSSFAEIRSSLLKKYSTDENKDTSSGKTQSGGSVSGNTSSQETGFAAVRKSLLEKYPTENTEVQAPKGQTAVFTGMRQTAAQPAVSPSAPSYYEATHRKVTQDAGAALTLAVARTQAEAAQKEYQDYMVSREREDAKAERRAQRVRSTSASTNPRRDMQTNPDVDEKEQELKYKADYFNQRLTSLENQEVTRRSLRELESWPEEDRELLKFYYQYQQGGYGNLAEGIAAAVSGSGASSGAYSSRNTQAAQAYQYLSRKYGADKVKELGEAQAWNESEELTKQTRQQAKQGSDGFWGGLGSSIVARGASLAGNFTAPLGVLSDIATRTGQYSTLNPNNIGNLPNVYAGAVTENVSENLADKGFLGKAASGLYKAGMSAADNLIRIAAAGGTGSLALAGTGSFGQTVAQASAQGASPEQALLMGVIDGGLEVITEKISLDNLLKDVGNGPLNAKEIVRKALIQGGVEVSEEEASFIGSTLAEAAILREKSEYDQKIAELMADGKSYQEAREQANLEVIREAEETAIQSFLSALMMSGGTSVYSNTINRLQGKAAGASPRPTVEDARNGLTPQTEAGDSQHPAAEVTQPDTAAPQTANQSPEGVNTAQAETAQESPLSDEERVRRSLTIDSPAPAQYNTGKEQDTNTGNGGKENGKELQGAVGEGLPGGTETGRIRGTETGRLPVSGQASGGVEAGTEMVPGGVQGESGRGDSQNVLRVSGELRVSEQLQKAQQERGTPTYAVKDTTTDPEAYEQALKAGRESDPDNGWCVTPKSAQQLREGNVRTLMNENGTVGVGIAPDGDIVAVFKNKNGGPPKALDTMMPIAIEQGGDRLDCYGKGLADLYEKYGFEPVARVEFNPEYANEGWTPDKGTPYIYVMKHNGDSADTVAQKIGTYPIFTYEQLDALPTYGKDAYGDAIAYRDSLMGEKAAPSGDASEGGAQMEHGSVGAANRGFSGNEDYDVLLSDENVQPRRASDSERFVVEVPKVDPQGRDVSEFAHNAMNSDVISPRDINAAKRLIVEGAFGHDTQKMADVRDRVYQEIQEKGIAKSVYEVSRAAANGKLSEYDIAKAETLFAITSNKSGKTAAGYASDLLVDLTQMATQSGRQLNMFKLLRMLTPEGQLMTAQKNVQRYVDKLNQGRSAKKQVSVEISEEAQRAFLDAKSEAEAQEALDRIYKEAAAQIPPTIGEKFDAWRHLSMLGNAVTHARNFLATGAFRPMASIKRSISAGIQALTLDRKNRTAAVLGFGENSRELMKWAKSDAKTGDVQAMMKGTYQNGDEARNAISDYRTMFKNKWLEALRKFNVNAMEAEDMFWKKREYALTLASFLKARGYSAQQAQSGAVPEAVLNEGRQLAVQESLKSTFNDRNKFSDTIAKFRVKGNGVWSKALNGMAKGILPYTRTPANILVRAKEYSPAEMVKSVKNMAMDVRSGKKTAAQCIDEMASGLTGTGITLLGIGLAAGIIPGVRLVGEVPEDEEDEDIQPYSIYIGDVGLSIAWLAPTSIPLFVGANLYNSIRTAKQDDDVDAWDIANAIVDSAVGVMNPILELSCMSSIYDALEKMSYEDTAGDKAYALVYHAATQYFMQALPTVFGQLEKALEPNKKQVFSDGETKLQRNVERTIGTAFRKLPGDPFQTDKVDEWGEVVKDDGNTFLRVVNAFFNPMNVTKLERTPLTEEIKRLNQVQPDSVSPPDTAKTITFTASDGSRYQNRRLTEEEYSTLAKVQGQTAKALLEKIIESKSYQALTDTQKAQVFDYVYDYAREKGRTEAIAEYPGLSDSWMADVEADGAGAVLRKVAAKGFTDAMDDMTAAWREGTDAGSAVEALEQAYQVYNGLDVTDKAKIKNSATGRLGAYLTAAASGIKTDAFAELYRQYYDIDQSKDGTSQKAEAWAYALEKAREKGKITEKQKGVLKDALKFYQMFPASTDKFDQMTEAGISADNAKDLGYLLDGIKPEDGHTGVRDVQKAEGIAGSKLSEADKIAALKIYGSDAQDENLDLMLEMGYSSGEYAAVWRIYADEKAAGGKGTKERTIQAIMEELGCSRATATAVYNIYG